MIEQYAHAGSSGRLVTKLAFYIYAEELLAYLLVHFAIQNWLEDTYRMSITYSPIPIPFGQMPLIIIFNNMKFLVIFVLMLVSLDGLTQIVRGRILEANTGKPISRASIYIEGSFRAAVSDSSGYFLLHSGMSNKVPIFVSCVGFSALRISDYSDAPLEIHLEPKVYQIREVVVVDDGMSFEEKLSIFKKEFLGTSPAALACFIENEDDITFKYDRKNRTLEAFSDQPLIVNNKELGYKVSYFLDNFTVTPGTTALNGHAKFEENDVRNRRDSMKVLNKREDIYLDSRMHFIRSVWKNEVDKNNFRIYGPEGNRINSGNLIVVKDGLKYLRVPNQIRIVRNGMVSTLIGQNKFALSYIDENGYYDADELIWRGAMAAQRIGDLLPLEYKSD